MTVETPLRGRTVTAALLGLLLAFALPVGCSGPERAPRQPITGVDRPEDDRATNPHDIDEGTVSSGPLDPHPPAEPADAGPPSVPSDPIPTPSNPIPPVVDVPMVSAGNFDSALDQFIAKIAAAAFERPGVVAVFWPISPHPLERDQWIVNGLGERIAGRIADGLRSEGVTPLAEEGLVNDIAARNRSLHDFRELSDVFALGERIGAIYVVYGSTHLTTYDRLDRDQVLEIGLRCKCLIDNHDVARLKHRVSSGAEARILYRDYGQRSRVRIAAEADPVQPSTDAEIAILMDVLTSRIAVRHGRHLRGKRAYVETTAIPATAGRRATLLSDMEDFRRAYEEAEREASRAGAEDPAQAALESLGEAYDRVQRQRRDLAATRSGGVATDLGRTLMESLMGSDSGIQVVADEGEREALLSLIRAEADAAQSADAVDPATIAFMRAKGAQIMIRSSLRRLRDAYQLRIRIYDIAAGSVVASESILFEPRFTPDIDRITQD